MNYKSVLISAGHSNQDSGAVVPQYTEAQLALRIRNLVVEELIKIIPTRLVVSDGYPNTNMSLVKAIGLEKLVSGPKVEFHFNSANSSSAEGIEALSTPQNKGLAKQLAGAVAVVTGSPLRGENGWKDQAHAGPHSRLGFCTHGGVIVELEFLTNPNRMKTYLKFEKDVAKALATIIENWARKG